MVAVTAAAAARNERSSQFLVMNAIVDASEHRAE